MTIGEYLFFGKLTIGVAQATGAETATTIPPFIDERFAAMIVSFPVRAGQLSILVQL
jgi:hypothetical protein